MRKAKRGTRLAGGLGNIQTKAHGRAGGGRRRAVLGCLKLNCTGSLPGVPGSPARASQCSCHTASNAGQSLWHKLERAPRKLWRRGRGTRGEATLRACGERLRARGARLALVEAAQHGLAVAVHWPEGAGAPHLAALRMGWPGRRGRNRVRRAGSWLAFITALAASCKSAILGAAPGRCGCALTCRCLQAHRT